jgi:hypothetical protein|tara:strand:+ start:1797 stop:2495 length:699 start_codon:yes stop_codon:yes gene_type:complete
MAVSGTSTFNLDIAEICEEAYERAGLEMRSGYDLATARRSLNLMSLEWANRGINLWLVEEGSVTLATGTATYPLPSDTIDLLEHTLRTNSGETNQTDTSLTRMSVSTYSQITNKLTSGTPTQIYIDRQRDAPNVTLWPVPNSTLNGDFVRYFRLRRIQDVGSKSSNDADIPARFLPCMVAGLSYYLALKRPQAAQRVPTLKAIYEEQFDLAAEEDREKANLVFTPLSGYYSL